LRTVTVSLGRGNLGFLGWLDQTRSAHAAVPLLELINSSGCVHKFLFTCKKRVTSGTDADFDLVAGGSGAINGSARAHDDRIGIVGMDICFHSNGVGNVGDSASYCNPFLARWEKVSSGREREPAIFAADGRVVRTFGEISARALDIARNLRGCSHVAVAAGSGPVWPEALLGVWLAGGVVIPCAGGDMEGGVLPEGAGWIGADGQVKSGLGGGDFDGVDLLKVTSGTTSGRRLVGFSAKALLADADHVAAGMGIGPGDRNLAVIPFEHSYGLTNLTGCLLAVGAAIVLTDGRLPREIAEAARCGEASVLPAVPAIFRALNVLDALPGSLRLAISAGALLASKDARDFHRRFARKIHSFYGASECGGICYDASGDAGVPEGYVGTALPGVRVNEVEFGGGTVLRVEGAALGMRGLPEMPEDTFRQGYFQPADLVERCGNGFRIVGRASDFINVAGKKVNPSAIESALREIPGVSDAVVFGVLSPGRGEMVAACVVAGVDDAAIKTGAASKLPGWQVPRVWVRVDELPVNARGKLSRRALKERFFGPAA
jgi:long-chain acyl-CoA synthetase